MDFFSAPNLWRGGNQWLSALSHSHVATDRTKEKDSHSQEILSNFSSITVNGLNQQTALRCCCASGEIKVGLNSSLIAPKSAHQIMSVRTNNHTNTLHLKEKSK